METITKNINGVNFTYICSFFNTRSGFGHEARLCTAGKVYTSKCYYLNRTWEAYTYQTACKRSTNKLIETITQELCSSYKKITGCKRLTAKKRHEILNNNTNYLEAVALYESL